MTQSYQNNFALSKHCEDTSQLNGLALAILTNLTNLLNAMCKFEMKNET